MERIILYGAGIKGSKIFNKSILSYDETKRLNLPYAITVSEKYKDEIISLLKTDNMEYYKDIFRWLQLKHGLDATELNRDYCAFYHVEKMDSYFEKAETKEHLDVFWGESSLFVPFFNQLKLDAVVELACGRGRHVEKYADKAGKIVLVDILEKNIEYCRQRFKDRDNIYYYQNSGFDLSGLRDCEYTALFTYDAMVHFEMFDIYQYLRETYRILERGGKALFHHSNFVGGYDQSFYNAHNLGGRNFMSKELFAYLSYKAGFDIIKQKVIDWSETNLDCITLVQKP